MTRERPELSFLQLSVGLLLSSDGSYRYALTVASARPSRREIPGSRDLPRHGSGEQAPQPCAVHAHDHPPASLATIPVAADGLPNVLDSHGASSETVLVCALRPTSGARPLSAGPEAASRLDSCATELRAMSWAESSSGRAARTPGTKASVRSHWVSRRTVPSWNNALTGRARSAFIAVQDPTGSAPSGFSGRVKRSYTIRTTKVGRHLPSGEESDPRNCLR
jgi:hypothetical protein